MSHTEVHKPNIQTMAHLVLANEKEVIKSIHAQ